MADAYDADLAGLLPIDSLRKEAQSYLPPYGQQQSLSSLGAPFDDLLATGLDAPFTADDLLDPGVWGADTATSSDGYGSAATRSVSPMPIPVSPQPQYAAWPNMPQVPTYLDAAPTPFAGSPPSSLGMMTPPSLNASPPRMRPVATPSAGAIAISGARPSTPKRQLMPLFGGGGSPSKGYRFSPIGYNVVHDPLEITPRSASGMVRSRSSPAMTSPGPARRRTTSTAASRQQDPNAAQAVLPTSPQTHRRARTASRPLAPTGAKSDHPPMPVSLFEAMAALDLIQSFVHERQACEHAGCRNCTAGGTIADESQHQVIKDLTERVRQRIATASTRTAVAGSPTKEP